MRTQIKSAALLPHTLHRLELGAQELVLAEDAHHLWAPISLLRPFMTFLLTELSCVGEKGVGSWIQLPPPTPPEA